MELHGAADVCSTRCTQRRAVAAPSVSHAKQSDPHQPTADTCGCVPTSNSCSLPDGTTALACRLRAAVTHVMATSQACAEG